MQHHCITPAYEVVSSIFPDWEFSEADATAAFGLHAGLILGAKSLVKAMGTALMQDDIPARERPERNRGRVL
jgi:hypothetical protein